MSLGFKRNSMWKDEFLFCSVLIMLGLSQLFGQAGKRFISFLFCFNLFIISKHFILKTNYYARRYPRVMKYCYYFHGTRGIVRTRVCVASVWTQGRGGDRIRGSHHI